MLFLAWYISKGLWLGVSGEDCCLLQFFAVLLQPDLKLMLIHYISIKFLYSSLFAFLLTCLAIISVSYLCFMLALSTWLIPFFLLFD